MKTLIGISGFPGSGKTTIARALSRRLNIPLFSFGAFIRRKTTDPDLQAFGQQYVRQSGERAFVEDFLAFNTVTSETSCVVEGVRHRGVWRALGEKAESQLLVFLNTPTELLYERLRQRSDLLQTTEIARLSHPVEGEVAKLYELADLIVSGQDVEATVALIVDATRLFVSANPR